MLRHRLASTTIALLVASLFITALPTTASADDDDVPGEVVLITPFEFVKFKVNDKDEWENHEYTGRNKTLHILGLSRDDDNTIVLTPRVEGYEPLTLVIKPSDFKSRRVRRGRSRIAVYQFKKRVRFAKKGEAKKDASKKAHAKKAAAKKKHSKHAAKKSSAKKAPKGKKK